MKIAGLDHLRMGSERLDLNASDHSWDRMLMPGLKSDNVDMLMVGSIMFTMFTL